MLTRAKIKATKEELQANYRRLNQPEATVLADLEMNAERLDAVLNMESTQTLATFGRSVIT